MDARPRFMSRELTRGQRRVYGAVTIFFVVVFVAMIWPVYARFSGIRPVLLGIPFSLFYVVAFLAASFLVLLGLFAWEGRRDEGDGGRTPEDGDGGTPGDGRDGTPTDGPGARAGEGRA